MQMADSKIYMNNNYNFGLFLKQIYSKTFKVFNIF